MKTLILCGGRGLRAYPETVELPKPLLEVGGRPVLGHLMEIYAVQGHTDFVLAAGYKAHLIAQFAKTVPSAWEVEVVDTGEETNTGGRVLACAEQLGEQFFLTYADGLADVDLGTLAAFHRGHRGSATVTTVPLPSPYGTFGVGQDGSVRSFVEKPRLPDHLINAGFFIMDARVFEHWSGEDLEREVLPALADAGELFAYRHPGFWRSLDTYKDAQDLTQLCLDGSAPWMPASSSQRAATPSAVRSAHAPRHDPPPAAASST